MTRALLAAGVLTLAGLPALAQQPVSGVIKNPEGGPIAGAEVMVANRKTVTDSAGRFRVDSLKPGNLAFAVRAQGFWPYRSRLTLRTRPLELELTLRPSLTELPEIVVEGRRTGIYGVVGDVKTGGRTGAKVEVIGHGGGAQLTDSAGRFAFPAADRGDYLIVVSLPGYEQRRISLRIDDGKARELSIRIYPGAGGGPTRIESWAFDQLRSRLASWPRRTRMTRAELDKYPGVESICDIARVQNAAGAGVTVILNGILTLENWPLCDFRADEVELIEFSRDAPTGYRRGAGIPRGGAVYIWERR